jgi:HSP20 family protein
MASSLSARQGLVAPARTTLSRRQQRAARRSLASAAPRAEAAPPAEPAAAEQQQQLAAPAEEQRAVAPRALSPLSNFGHMQQMLAEMDRKMAMLGRAVGMPMPRMALSPLASMLAEVPGWAAPSSLAAPAAISLAVDVKDTGDALHITADVPGVPAEGLKLEVSPDGVLTISGERNIESRSGSEEEGNLRIERSFGTFTRRLRLPDGVNVEGIKATAKDGVLSISVPKGPQPQPVHIPVQAAGDQPAADQPAEQGEQEPAAPAEDPAQQDAE